MLLAAIAFAAFCATFAGGLFALRLKDRLHLVLGFSAGAVVGVALFDLLPAALDLGAKYHDSKTLMSWVALGFSVYLVADRVVASRNTRQRGALGAGSLSMHSFFDGIAIGLAFQVSTSLGAIVTLAVLAHDFSDGINTMSVVLKNGGDRRRALQWLTIDALAPVLGVASTYFFAVPDEAFGAVLAVFAGFFLFIGASDLIPESHHAHPKMLTTAMTLLGAGVIYLAVVLAGA
ncbi:MAG TPA: ZIP family metal transporter [Pseudomonadales bacterium]|nr:ZIP family metal transporter [Pseudomonadales bacterium]